MRSPSLFNLVFAGAFLVPSLATEAASAQDADGVRFRGGVGLEAGALIPAPVVLGGIGVAGQLGAQINNTWGAYAVPSFDVLFGNAAGVGFGLGAMADYTFDNLPFPLSVAAGPEVGVFAAFGSSSTGASAAGGAYYGVRLRGEYYLTLSSAPRRRKALFVALDLHLDGDAFGGAATCSVNGCGGGAGGFLFSPMASIGYVAF